MDYEGMTREQLIAEIERLKAGIKRNDTVMMVDGDDMTDHGWTTIRAMNLRLAEQRKLHGLGAGGMK